MSRSERLATAVGLAVVVAVVVLILPPGAGALAAALAVLAIAGFMRPREAVPSTSVALAGPDRASAGSISRGQITPLLDLFGEGILLLDAERTVIAANLSAAKLLGRPRDAMLGVSLIRAARDYAFLQVLQEAAGEPREVVLDDRVIFATAGAVEAGEIRTVLTLQDLTALRRAERSRQELVGNVSHELRTPIAAALALSETLEGGVDDAAQRARFHGQLTSELERLGRMVDRLLRLSRIESRVEEFYLEDVSVVPILEEARRRIEPVAERGNVSLAVAEADASLMVHADRERVLEVLANLLDNAIRHSPSGGTVTLSAERDAGDASLVRVCVTDQGPGIMPQERLRVFERFYTTDRARADIPGGGTGLGLAIARHIVTRHGGEIWVADHQPGARLCFTLRTSAT